MLSCSCWLVLINVACKDSCHPFCLEWHDDPVWQRLSHSSCSTWKSKSWLLCLWPWREMALSTGHRWGCHFASLWLTQADLLWDVTSFCLQDLFAHSVCFCSKVTWKTELLLAGVKEWISLWKLSAKCLSPSLISERTGSLFTRSALWQFYAIPCSLFLYLVFPCPCFVVWSKGNERKIFFSCFFVYFVWECITDAQIGIWTHKGLPLLKSRLLSFLHFLVNFTRMCEGLYLNSSSRLSRWPIISNDLVRHFA